jgi:hypothetical protein
MGKNNKMCELKPGEPPFLDALGGVPRCYCKKCGRVARDPSFLCKPKDLPTPDAEAGGRSGPGPMDPPDVP